MITLIILTDGAMVYHLSKSWYKKNRKLRSSCSWKFIKSWTKVSRCQGKFKGKNKE